MAVPVPPLTSLPPSGNCTNPGSMYMNSAALGTTRFNTHLWQHNDRPADAGGLINGSAPNSWLVRHPSEGSDTIQSVVLYPNQGRCLHSSLCSLPDSSGI